MSQPPSELPARAPSATPSNASNAMNIDISEGFPLKLEHMASLDLSKRCPIFNALSANPGAIGSLTGDVRLQQQFKAELEFLRSSSGTRARQLQEEIVKVDQYIRLAKMREKQEQVALMPYNIAAAGPTTVKLKLGLATDDPPAVKRKYKKRDPDVKRKRGNSADVESSDADAGEYKMDETSHGASSSPLAKDVKMKKKQRLSGDNFVPVVRKFDKVFDTQAQSETPDASSVPPSGDTKIKPSQQIPGTTFWNYVDPHFKLITDDDIVALSNRKQSEAAPFVIPPLGRHYLEQWLEEDKALMPSTDDFVPPKPEKKPSKKQKSTVPELSPPTSTDSFCGPITERLVSAMMQESDGVIETFEQDDLDSLTTNSFTGQSAHQLVEEEYNIEERLKRELRYIGLLDDDDEEAQADTNDEISAELWRLQGDLRKLVLVNSRREQILEERAVVEMAWQEFNLVLDEINRQVESVYMKKFRNQPKKRKRQYGRQAPEGVTALLDRRQRLIVEFAPLFPPSQYSAPTSSLFGDDLMQLKDISYLHHPLPFPRAISNRSNLSLLNGIKTEPLTEGSVNSSMDQVALPVETVPALPSKPKKKLTVESDSTIAEAPAAKKPKKPRAPRAEGDPPPKPRKPSKKKQAEMEAAAAQTVASTSFIPPAANDASQLIGNALDDLFALESRDLDGTADIGASGEVFGSGQGMMVPEWMLG